MELSLTPPSSSLGFPASRPNPDLLTHQSETTHVNPTGKLSQVSSIPRYSRCLPSAPLHRLRSCSKHGSSVSCGRNPIQIKACTQVGANKSDSTVKGILDFSGVLWRFLRPYTLRGAVLIYTAIMARTWIENSHLLKGSFSFKALAILVALLCTRAYITGINQIFDVEIDRINKPYLALAAGELSMESAWMLVTCYVAIGMLATGVVNSTLFTACICTKYFLGCIYSVPPIRLKNSSIGAVIKLTMGSILTGFGVGSAARFTLGLPFGLSLPMVFFICFITMFYSVFAVMKDLPDVEGDTRFGVRTLASTIGIRNTTLVGSGVLLLNYVGAILTAIYNPQAFRQSITIPAHIALVLYLILQVCRLEKANYSQEETQAFYLFLWKLVDAECIIFPFI